MSGAKGIFRGIGEGAAVNGAECLKTSGGAGQDYVAVGETEVILVPAGCVQSASTREKAAAGVVLSAGCHTVCNRSEIELAERGAIVIGIGIGNLSGNQIRRRRSDLDSGKSRRGIRRSEVDETGPWDEDGAFADIIGLKGR